MADILKLDLKRKYRHLLNPNPKRITVVDVPEFHFLMLDGQGDPNTSQDYQDAVNVLYSVAYTLKFMIKKGTHPVDYPVMALEGLWWVDNLAELDLAHKDNWKWTMMIMQPEPVKAELVEQAKEQALERKELPALPRMRFEAFNEGLSAQIMHIGPYAQEAPTLEKLHGYIQQNGYAFNGKHHEIYQGDPRRTAPARLKTILRQPIRLSSG